MISVSNVSVSFSGTYLYEEISFLINQKDRIGLAGKNGAGKSTLLKILSGEMKPDSGEVSRPSGITLGYLPQDMVHNLGKTVFDETSTAFAEIKQLEKKLAEISLQLETRTDYESDGYMKLINDLNDANERMNLLGAYSMDSEIEQTLLGLGFERKDFGRMTDEFSGGWRMRIELAKLLLQKPNVLLLDEPTNHLDIESIQWLEDLLKNYYGAVVMVSHDKAFLDNITTRTIEISLGQLFDYRANYSRYLLLRKERREQQAAAHKNQQKFIEKTEALIDKYRAKASKASFAQSLIKKLDKIEVIEVDGEDNASIRFNFPPAPRAGKVVVEANRLKKAYGPKVIFSDIDYMIEREDRVAFVGKNGEGKSTMSKLIVGDEPFEGTLKIGHNVNIGYYAQNQAETLDGEATVFETIDEVAVGDARKNVRSLLGSFLFSGDDVDKKVKVLSGGEKGRLAMCKLLLQPYSLLVLDEPTNHLDMRSKEVLKSALMRYDGTLIVVSHDRDFLQGLTTKVFEFKGGSIKPHIGDVNDYLAMRKIESFKELEQKTKQTKVAAAAAPVAENKVNHEEQKQKEKEVRTLQNQVSKSEQEIARLEMEIKKVDDKLLDPEQYNVVVSDKEMFSRYEAMKKQLEAEMMKWEDLQGKAEALQKS
ncbi:MAG TPA: ABC-F family ATP-binding cassette domain-containing protein [Bacteroidia bacterium]|jgi:ATP-binding cassette subfamily F protein 3|nr:ABC-F family ATP-binding cassette domain-containing protein [Bacteroidia bacterium]